MEEVKSLRVWTEENKEHSIVPSLGKVSLKCSEVSAEILVENIQGFIRKFQSILNDQENHNFDYGLEEIELNLSVNAQGGIELIGKLSVGVTTSVKVRLMKRRKD